MDCSEVSCFAELKKFLEERKSNEGDKDYLVILSDERAIMVRKIGSSCKLMCGKQYDYQCGKAPGRKCRRDIYM